MLDIEQAIREVGTVYQALTGRPIQAAGSELPPEIDASARAHIEDRYRQFKTMTAPPAAQTAATPWAPGIVVVESEAEVRYEIDLPAVSRGEVGVSVLGAFLLVRGQRGAAPSPGAHLRYCERRGGPFQRLIALPPRARRDGIQATLRDGVLTVTVPTDGPGGEAVSVEVR